MDVEQDTRSVVVSSQNEPTTPRINPTSLTSIHFDVDELKGLIKEEEWYNIPDCLKLCISKLIEAAEAQKSLLVRHEKNFMERVKFLEQQLNLEKSVAKSEQINVEKRFDLTNKRFHETMKKLKIEIDTNLITNTKFSEELSMRVEKCGIALEKNTNQLHNNTVDLNKKITEFSAN